MASSHPDDDRDALHGAHVRDQGIAAADDMSSSGTAGIRRCETGWDCDGVCGVGWVQCGGGSVSSGWGPGVVLHGSNGAILSAGIGDPINACVCVWDSCDSRIGVVVEPEELGAEASASNTGVPVRWVSKGDVLLGDSGDDSQGIGCNDCGVLGSDGGGDSDVCSDSSDDGVDCLAAGVQAIPSGDTEPVGVGVLVECICDV